MTSEDSFDSLFLHQKQYQLSANEGDGDKDQLLSYYRSRLDLFEREREEWLEKLEGTRVRMEEVHKQEWELKARNDEVRTLQQQLSDLQIVLLNEREQIVKLARENDSLQLQAQESQRKIGELLSIVHPVQQEVTFFQDKRPQSVFHYPQSTDQPGKPTKSRPTYCGTCKNVGEFTGKCTERHTARLGRTSSTPKHVIKTVYLPNEQMNTLAMEVETLRKQLEQEHAIHESEIEALKEDRRVREHEYKLRNEADAAKIESLMKNCEKEESAHAEAVKDYLRLRHHSQQRERQLLEQSQQLQSQVDSLLTQLRQTHLSSLSNVKEAERIAEEKTKDFTHKFRSQVVDSEESLQIMREQYAQLQSIYKEKVNDLETRLTRLMQKYKDLDERKSLEVAGYRQEVETLRKLVKRKEEGGDLSPPRPAKSATEPRRPQQHKVCERCRVRYNISQSPERNDNSWKC